MIIEDFKIEADSIHLGRRTTDDQLKEVAEVFSERYGVENYWYNLRLPNNDIELNLTVENGSSLFHSKSRVITGAYFTFYSFSEHRRIRRGINANKGKVLDLAKLDKKKEEIEKLYRKDQELISVQRKEELANKVIVGQIREAKNNLGLSSWIVLDNQKLKYYRTLELNIDQAKKVQDLLDSFS